MTKNNHDTSHYEGALLENIQDIVMRMAEALSSLVVKVNDIDIRLQRVEKNTELMLPVLQAAVKDQSKQLNNHERRIVKLEVAEL
ncbi:MAG: hypothetical protein ACR2FM_01800 [Candidatus Saccharimonadales bacterium]